MDQNNTDRQKTVIVIGHKNPDTDSICSAIAYAELKNRTVGPWHEPCRTGEMNRETHFVLNRFGVKPPRVCPDVYAEVQDIDIRPVGCTATIIYQLYCEAGEEIAPDIAGILICADEDVETLVEEAFGVEVKDGTACLPGVISRKKQLIPALLNTLRKM